MTLAEMREVQFIALVARVGAYLRLIGVQYTVAIRQNDRVLCGFATESGPAVYFL